MSYGLRRKQSVRAALRSVVRRRIASVHGLLGGNLDPEAGENIHKARKHLKHVRAILRLVSHDTGGKHRARAARRLRMVARSLTPLRDVTVLLATVQGLYASGALT